MAKAPDSPEPDRIRKTYFYDFVKRVKAAYPPASLHAIVLEIAFAREYPALAGMRRSSEGYRQLTIAVGFGHRAVIELEYDEQGRLQPLTGEIL